MTDYWPDEEGAIFDSLSYILPCVAGGAITEGSCVKVGTAASGQINVAASTVLGDGIGVATRATTNSGDMTPVLFYGVFKMLQGGTTAAGNGITIGSMVMNSITTSVCAVKNAGTWAAGNAVAFGGTSYVLGMALQTSAATAGDEILILVGKCI